MVAMMVHWVKYLRLWLERAMVVVAIVVVVVVVVGPHRRRLRHQLHVSYWRRYNNNENDMDNSILEWMNQTRKEGKKEWMDGREDERWGADEKRDGAAGGQTVSGINTTMDFGITAARWRTGITNENTDDCWMTLDAAWSVLVDEVLQRVKEVFHTREKGEFAHRRRRWLVMATALRCHESTSWKSAQLFLVRRRCQRWEVGMASLS